MSVSKVEAYILQKKESASPGNAEIWRELEELYSKKLWHPLTLKLKAAILDPNFTKGENLEDVYKNFIHDFEHRINPLLLVEIIRPVSASIKDTGDSIKFLEKIQTTVKNHPTASILAMTCIATLKLGIKDKEGRCTEMADVRQIVESAQKQLNAIGGVTPVHGEFHKVNSIYFREIGDFSSYYKEALRYLGCTDLAQMSEEGKMQAFCLGFAALLGEDVYNFGELLSHPILDYLKGTADKWLVDLLLAFNAGDLQRFDELRPQWSAWNDLKKNTVFLERKIRMLCVMEMSFARPAKHRHIAFKEISEMARMPLDEVEFLVMKALSRGLIKGLIHQVDQYVAVTWVQPRVLDKQQMANMAERFEEWCRDVKSMEHLVENRAEEILVKS